MHACVFTAWVPCCFTATSRQHKGSDRQNAGLYSICCNQPLVMDYLPACIQVGMMKGIMVEKWLQFDTKERAGNLTNQPFVYIHTTF